MIYFVWIGIFSLMIVAQFWSFANDVYSKEEGERLLVIVGLGASLGAVAGARVADRLIEPFGVLQLMLLGAARARPPAAAHQLHRPRRSAAAGRPVAQVKKASAAPAAERVRDGVQDAVPAADGADDPDHQLDQRDRGVHPRQHRQGTRPGDDRRRNGRRPERGTDHRRLLRQVFLAGERARPLPPAVRGLAHHQAPRGGRGRDDPPGPLVRRLQHPHLRAAAQRGAGGQGASRTRPTTR